MDWISDATKEELLAIHAETGYEHYITYGLLYEATEALNKLADAVDYSDIFEVGGPALSVAWHEAIYLLDQIEEH